MGFGDAGVGLRRTGFTALAGWLFHPLGAGRTGRFFIKTDGLEDFLPETQLWSRVNAGRARCLRAEFFGTVAFLAAALGLAAIVAGTAFAVTATTAVFLGVLVVVTVLASA
jgi:hypothetical protein